MNRGSFPCNTHPEEIITNYCCLRSCQTPLCPDCIDEHNKKHKASGQFPEIDTLSRVKTMCNKQLSLVSITLEDLLNRLNAAAGINLDDIIQRSLSDLEKVKMRLIDQVNSYFRSLQDDFLAKIRSSSTRLPDNAELKTKLSNIIEEVNSIKSNLDGPNTFEAIKCTSSLDTQSLIANFEAKVQEALNRSVPLPTSIVVSDSGFANFSSDLKRIVTLDTRELKMTTNEQYLSQMPQKKDPNVLLYRSYFDDKFKNG